MQTPDLSQTPDRTLDAVLAIALFGWYAIEGTRDDGTTYSYLSQPDSADKTLAYEAECAAGHPGYTPRHRRIPLAACNPEGVQGGGYASDPAAALAVVEAMGERHEFTCEYRRPAGRPRPHMVTFMADETGADRGFARADEFPRAVALAAVRALHASGLLPPTALALLQIAPAEASS